MLTSGLVRESNPGPRAPETRIMPLDQRAVISRQVPLICWLSHATDSSVGRAEDCRRNMTAILRSLVQIRLGGNPFSYARRMHLIYKTKNFVSEVGFEPTPTIVDQNAPLQERLNLESGALDRSAIRTEWIRRETALDRITFAFGAAGHRSPYLSHAKRALYHLS